MKMRTRLKAAGWVGLAGVLMFGGPCAGWGQSTAGTVGSGANDAQVQAEVMKALDNKRFKDVKTSVQNGVVTLSGTVGIYSAKEDADQRAHHSKNIRGVENMIVVAAQRVDEVTLRKKLAEELFYNNA